MHHIDYIIIIKGFVGTGGEYRFSKCHNFANLPVFWRGYDCMKRDKMESIASILMKF